MKIIVTRLSTLLLLLLAVIAVSQNATNINQEQCSSAIIHKKLIQQDPVYRDAVQRNETLIQQLINTGSRSGGTYVIPVVVHVLHLGEPVGTGTNISVAQINSAIANLNTCYGGASPYSLDIGVQFQLAQRKFDCSATNGIVRVNASGTSNYATNGITSANEGTIKALSKWPNSEYYNIWIVSEIEGNNGGAGTQGYAYYPGASSSVDGAVILYNSFGYDPTGALGYNLKNYTNYNVTTLHELGHAFNLYHTFEGDDANSDGTADQCPSNSACASQGDLCCDTEAHRRTDGDCGASGTTCSGQSISNVVQNIMAYSSDYCQTKFTADQKTRIRAAIAGTRASLLTSPGLTAIAGSAPSATKSCSPQTSNVANNFGMGVFGLTIGSTSYSSSGAVADGGFRNNWCSNFNLTTNTLYSVTVTNGTLNNEKVRVYIDYNNDGDFVDAGENVYTDNTGAYSHTGSFTTPASPVTGQALWVRVISDFQGNTISGPCYVPVYGQVEDFSAVISNPGIPTTQVHSSQCAQTISDLTGYFYCNIVTAAQDYEWEFTNSGLGYSYTVTKGTANSYILKSAITGLTFGNTYNVRVRAKVGGVWGSYGSTCTITLAATVPATQVHASQCGQSFSDLNNYFYCNIVPGATDFEWEFTNSGLGYSTTTARGSGAANILRSSISGLIFGNTYNVRVRARVGGVWGSYGSTCTITLAAVLPTTQVHSSQCNQTMNLSGYFYCNIVPGATDFEWEFKNTGLGFSFITTRGIAAAHIPKSSITGLVNGVTYDVRVRPKVGGVWGNFSTTCQITINTAALLTLQPPSTAKMYAIDEPPSNLIHVNIYPNPSSYNGFTINYEIVENTDSQTLMELYNVLGVKVLNKQWTSSVGINEIKLNTDGNLPAGYYVIMIKVNNEVIKRNIVVE